MSPHARAKDKLAEIHHILETESLTAHQRAELEHHAAALSGALLSAWLPYGSGRRLLMLGIVVLGVQQALWVENYQPLFWWILLPVFSPRIMGEAAYFSGRLARMMRG